MNRPIHAIATDIIREWQPPSPHAAPYLSAMLCLSSPEDKYGLDDGHSIVLYFLSNASGFRGARARQLKQELKQAVGVK